MTGRSAAPDLSRWNAARALRQVASWAALAAVAGCGGAGGASLPSASSALQAASGLAGAAAAAGAKLAGGPHLPGGLGHLAQSAAQTAQHEGHNALAGAETALLDMKSGLTKMGGAVTHKDVRGSLAQCAGVVLEVAGKGLNPAIVVLRPLAGAGRCGRADGFGYRARLRRRLAARRRWHIGMMGGQRGWMGRRMRRRSRRVGSRMSARQSGLDGSERVETCVSRSLGGGCGRLRGRVGRWCRRCLDHGLPRLRHWLGGRGGFRQHSAPGLTSQIIPQS